MDAILAGFFADPLHYIGLLFAFAAGISTIIFMVGFFAGLPHFFTLSSNDDHQEHHRLRVTWGFTLLLYLFILWECIRIIASWFGYPAPQNTHVFTSFVMFLLVLFIVLWVMFKIKDRVVSGGH